MKMQPETIQKTNYFFFCMLSQQLREVKLLETANINFIVHFMLKFIFPFGSHSPNPLELESVCDQLLLIMFQFFTAVNTNNNFISSLAWFPLLLRRHKSSHTFHAHARIQLNEIDAFADGLEWLSIANPPKIIWKRKKNLSWVLFPRCNQLKRLWYSDHFTTNDGDDVNEWKKNTKTKSHMQTSTCSPRARTERKFTIHEVRHSCWLFRSCSSFLFAYWPSFRM